MQTAILKPLVLTLLLIVLFGVRGVAASGEVCAVEIVSYGESCDGSSVDSASLYAIVTGCGARVKDWDIVGDSRGYELNYVGSSAWLTPGANPKAGTVVVRVNVVSMGESACNPSSVSDQIDVHVTGAKPKCESGCGPFGGGDGDNNSVDVKLFLGLLDHENTAGYLHLKAETPSADLSKPISLVLPYSFQQVTVYRVNYAIRQVKVPQGLIRIIVINDYHYTVEFFYENQVQYPPAPSGEYSVTGSPFVTWIVINPDTSTANNRLWVSETRNSQEIQVFKYTYTANLNQWELTDSQNTRSIITRKSANGNTITYTRETIKNSDLYSKVETTKEVINGEEKVIKIIEGSGTAIRTRTNTYYGATGDGNAHKLRRVDYHGGNWSYFQYDLNGNISVEYSAWNNSPPPAILTEVPNPIALSCKKTEYEYTLNESQHGVLDNGEFRPNLPRCVTVKLPASGQLRNISKTFTKVGFSQIEVQKCTDPDALWGNPGNIISISAFLMEGPYAGQEKWQRHENGTFSVFTYTKINNIVTIQEDVGVPDDSNNPTLILPGIRLEKSYDALGRLISSTRKRINSATEIITMESENNTYLTSDPLGRDYDSVDLAGRTSSFRYDCCNLSSTTNPDGGLTTYQYDSLKRLTSTTVYFGGSQGIKHETIYDLADRPLVQKRIGTDLTSHTKNQFQYDILGRVIRETNAFGGIITHDETLDSGRIVNTTTLHYGATQVTKYFRDGSLDERSGTGVFPVKHEIGVEQLNSIWRLFSKTIQVASDSTLNEWTKTFVDGVGQPVKKIYSDTLGTPSEVFTYNSLGQQTKITDADGVVTLYSYNAEGELEKEAIDADRDGLTDTSSGTDRVSQTTSSYLLSGAPGNLRGMNIHKSDTLVWTNTLNGNTAKLRTQERSFDGLWSYSSKYRDPTSQPVTSYLRILPSSGGNRYHTNVQPDGSYTVEHFVYGRLNTISRRNTAGGLITQTTIQYDPHGRTLNSIDLRNGTTVFSYYDSDSVKTVTTPPPGTGQAPQVTSNIYDNLGRLIRIVQPDQTIQTNAYNANGMLQRTEGSRTYPVEYSYDAQGRVKTMKTWTNVSSAQPGAATTTWNYDAYRGWLSSKIYHGQTIGTEYKYTDAGRLKKRIWARGSPRIETSYLYGINDGVLNNDHGDLVKITYSDDLQDVKDLSHAYDRRGRLESTTLNANAIAPETSKTTTYFYNDANRLIGESYLGGTLDTLSVSNRFDTFNRRINLEWYLNAASQELSTYTYDTASRLSTVAHENFSVTYTYLANSPLVSQIDFKTFGTTQMRTTKVYDNLNRLSSISSLGAVSPVSSSYQYNAVNQRTRNSQNGSSFWQYEYDSLGQVKSGKKYWADGTLVPGQQFEYQLDDIGNRRETKTGGDQSGQGLRQAEYEPNLLNQYVDRDVPSGVDIIGVTDARAALTVNGNSQLYRRGEYFHTNFPVNNANDPIWLNIPVSSTYQSQTDTKSGYVFVPKNQEVFYHDADGNLLSDGRWTNTWDQENRLIQMESISGAPDGSKRKLIFEYDSKGRRIGKTVYVWNLETSQYVLNLQAKFLYDGWNLIAELDGSNGKRRSFMWGLDLSGTIARAGGVGGLLKVRNYIEGVTDYYVGYDGNGNVNLLCNAANGSTTAQYEYGPFGEIIRQTGSMAKVNPFRFSTKYQDDETDLIYYGYRFYNSSLGRWINRDPIQENGGTALFTFVRNDPINHVDYLGMLCCDDETIERGRKILVGRYNIAKSYLESRGVKHNGSRGASCITVNLPIFRFLIPAPDCWSCLLEHRQQWQGFPTSTMFDHWAVICRAELPSGGKKEILFDYWGDRSPGEDPNSWFRPVFPIYVFNDTVHGPDNGRPRNFEWLDIIEENAN